MFRFIISLLLLIPLQMGSVEAIAKKKVRSPAPIYYYPHLHKILGGKSYEEMGGDIVFFSYIHTALEVLKSPRKFDIYLEGYSFDIYPGSRYRMYPRDIRKIRRTFKRGFPKHISKWTKKQKKILLEFGPVTVLYALKKVRRIYAGDRWISTRKLKKRLNSCLDTLYFNAVENVFTSRLFSSWRDFYESLRIAQRGLSTRKCNTIFSYREKYLVKRLKRRRKRSRRPMLIIYGYAHDFGKYFSKHKIKYLGGPELQYAATCYHYRFSKILSPSTQIQCSRYFTKWLQALGHKHYFSGSIPATLQPDYNPGATTYMKHALQQYLKRRSPPVICRDSQSDMQIRIKACTTVIDSIKTPGSPKLKKSYIEAALHRADAYTRQFSLEKAIQDYKSVLNLAPDNPQTFHKLGYLYYLTNKDDKAIESFKKSIRLNPDYHENYHLLGTIYANASDFRSALKYLKLAVKTNPDNSRSLNNLAWALYKLKQPRKALRRVQQALRLDPESGAGYDTRAHIYEALGNYRRAYRDFKKALKILPDSEITKRGLNRVKERQ